MKKVQLICLGGIMAMSLCACSGSPKPVEKNKSNSETAVEEKTEADPEKTEDADKRSDVDWKKYSSLEEYAKTIASDFETSSDKLNKEWEAVSKDMSSYEAYRDNTDRITDFYAFCESESAGLYSGISDKAISYFKAIVESGAIDDYDKWNSAMDAFYDVWNNSTDDYYDVWNDIYDDSYDQMNSTVTMDATSNYQEYSDLWADMYKVYSDSWSKMYNQYSDSWSEVYALYSDVWSGFYSGEKDVDKIISEGKKKREEADTASSNEQSAPEREEANTASNNEQDESEREEEAETEDDRKSIDTDASETVFDPQDVSDETIESIETYGDYLIMYKFIIENYYANYEEAVKGTALYDEASFQQMKDEMNKEFEKQEEEYGDLKGKKIVGKDSVVQFLKDYRDSLQEMVDSYKETVSSL